MRLTSGLSVAVLVASAVSAASLVHAQPAPAPRARTDRLAVLPIVVEGKYGSATSSRIFNGIVSASDMRLGLRVITYEEMFVVAQEGLGDRVRDCGSDTGCISSRLRAFNARLGLVVVLDFASSPPLFSLQLLDTDDGTMLGSAVGEVRETKTAGAPEIIGKATGDLLDKAGYPRAGRVLVEVDPPNAHVTLGEGIDPDAGTPNRFTVIPGRYPVNAKLEGWSSGTAEATAVTGTEARIKIALTKETTLIESPWFWIGSGLVAIGGTLAIVAVTRHSPTCVCLMLKGDPSCGCDH